MTPNGGLVEIAQTHLPPEALIAVLADAKPSRCATPTPLDDAVADVKLHFLQR
ncbi:hypothetical protein P4S68_11400 [Pseudoalteromonas sp. Hal099]